MLTITLVFLGTTALHTVISEENTEIVKFLVDQGADIDKPDVHGWIPRALADYQGHEEIKALFQNKKETRKKPIALVPELQGVPYLKKHQSELTIAPFIPEVVTQTHADEVTWSDDNRTRRANIFHNSLFGIMSAANRPNRGEKGPFTSSHSFESPHRLGNNRARVTISCSGKGESTT